MATNMGIKQRHEAGGVRLVVENLAVLLSYWGVSHLNLEIFSYMGVLPMPLWPAAAVALLAALHLGWRVAPGIALGALFANAVSLGGSWSLAGVIAVGNTLGPLLAAAIVRRKIAGKVWSKWDKGDILVSFLACVVLLPVLSAAGGIGGKLWFELISPAAVPPAFMRWGLAHALGVLLFVPPLLFLPRKWIT